ncbi:MAG TPA: COX15/CtaA family protein [Thermomicrobiales bacterium]|nr:COX15/CtaA family protein [Thermomicrobiales bacterium]
MAQAAKRADAGTKLAVSRLFSIERLAVATVVLGYILILIGGVVRIEGAGMGCGDDWPICNGKVVPTFNYLTAIEYIHRVVAGMILLLTSWLTFVTWRGAHRSDSRRWLTLTALILVLALIAASSTALTGMAEGFFAIMIVVALLGRSRIPRPERRPGTPVLRAAIVAATTTFGLLLTGAYTASSGAAWACPEWPLCGNKYVPTGWSLVDIHVLHRWLAMLTVVSIVWLLVVALREAGPRARVTWLAAAALALTLTEVVIGATNIWLELADWVRISHLAFATLVWGSLVITVAESLPTRLEAQAEPAL